MSKAKPTHKILLVLPFWEGDRYLATALAHLLSDLQPGHCDSADFLLVARFDCDHDPRLVKYLSRKFNTYTHRSKRRGTGWPLGCNDLTFGALEFIYHRMQSGKIPNYKAVYFMGADCAPFRSDWISYLHGEWDRVNAQRKIYVAGGLAPGPDERGHINGDCCLLSGDLTFLKWLVMDVGGVTVNAGWDWVLAGEFHGWGLAGIPGVQSHWRRPDLNEYDWDQEKAAGTVWLHGVKNDSLIKISRKKLIG